MAKMETSTLKAIIGSEKEQALASIHASKLTNDRQDAMDYYYGDMQRALPTEVGRSEAVSTDVADTVEGLMPQLMDIFCGNGEVVRFEPTRADDIEQAEQESDYVNHKFMQTGGFMTLYSMIKDALLSKTGLVKAYWCEETIEKKETYLDQDEATYQYLIQQPGVEVIEHSERPATGYDASQAQPALPGQPPAPPPMIHDVTLVFKDDAGYAKHEPVPPEEFGISRMARTIKNSGYMFHEVQRSQAELIDQGYDETQLKTLPTYESVGRPEVISRDTADESRLGTQEMNDANRQIMVTEHYIRLDYEGDGKPKLYRVTTGGEQGEILKRVEDDGTKKDDIIEWDTPPFAAITPVPVTHRFFGRSIADLVMDIQRIKTSLLRALLDNAYLANNPRTEISESHASENTIDDLLVSRPGGIVRTKQPGGLNTLTTPPIGGHVFPLIEYMDGVREWRTGSTKQGQGLDANVLQNQSATAVVQSFNASQAKLKLIAKIFAETGIRDFFALYHGIIRKNSSKAETIRLRGKWVQVDPRDWKERNDMTINVGLGTGGKAEELQDHMIIVQAQTQAASAGLTNLVTAQNLYNSAKRLVKITGERNVDLYFTDPSTQPPLQPKPDPKLMEIQAQAQGDMQELQMKAQLDQQKLQGDQQLEQVKTQAEMALGERKFQLEAQIKTLEAELHLRQVNADMAMKQQAHEHQLAIAAMKARTAQP